ncbi:imidazolonepropionase [Acinetobacter larvae]|uniref:Imidazolonepropionase n=1 Tax=Acinetobacter larvae TaxID=1789224 RepID=A0A1B2LZI5_9GAMM|nr:imidazolonepropionase [Acinetobacter larvae]AOA58362.1 imidazolonepropionase [Acinetobacter larvae]
MQKIWHNCHVVTMQDGHYHMIHHAAIVSHQQRIVWIGESAALTGMAEAQWIDLAGAWVTPGLIDCHTHSVFGGNRSIEFEQRLEGMSYAEIAAQGGGIASTVRATRAASAAELYQSARKRIIQLLNEGVTALEIKSGYGLDLDNEAKMLRVIRQLAADLAVDIQATCLAAHALPPEYQHRADDYIAMVCQEMLPRLHAEGLIDAVDAFCEHLAFSPSQVQRVFACAQALGLPVKIHAEQLSAQHGASLAARYQALSADHLEYLTEQDAQAMAKAGTVAVLLPGAFYFLRESKLPDIAALQRHGVKIALSTDLNPGTSPVLSIRLIMNMASTLFKLTPEQVLAGVTLHAAQALGLQDSHGSLEVGKFADFIAWDIDHPAEIVYWLGGDLNKRVIYHGEERSASSL